MPGTQNKMYKSLVINVRNIITEQFKVENRWFHYEHKTMKLWYIYM